MKYTSQNKNGQLTMDIFRSLLDDLGQVQPLGRTRRYSSVGLTVEGLQLQTAKRGQGRRLQASQDGHCSDDYQAQDESL